MTKRRMKIATLDEEGIDKIRKMEESMDTLIVALEPHYPLAELKDDQIDKLQELENQLDVVLIAYRD